MTADKKITPTQKTISSPLVIMFVRHAQATQGSRALSGQEDPALTDLGLQQASRVARRLQNEEFAHAYTSTLVRARETAKHILGYHRGVSLSETPDLVEICRDHFVGVPDGFKPAPKELVERERDALQRFANRLRHAHEPGQKILVVAHGNLIRSIMPILGGRNPLESLLVEINNTAVCVLDLWASGAAVLQLGNCVKHLLQGEVT